MGGGKKYGRGLKPLEVKTDPRTELKKYEGVETT
jgi:hypothetical protein